jgi:energy-coupling factor transporter transmembrane protein EcfT
MNTQTGTEVRDYVARMRAELSDLPAAEVGEIMDDAEAHVAEVAAELGEEFSAEALTGRLGTPEVYARELRVAAGYPPRTAEPAGGGARSAFLARFAFWALVAAVLVAFAFAVEGRGGVELVVLVGFFAAVATALVFWQRALLPEVEALPETRALGNALRRAEQSEAGRVLLSLRALQPAWWVVRALLIAAAGAVVYGFGPSFLLVTLAFGALSLMAGAKSRTDRRWLWISLPATGFALGVLLLLLGSLVARSDYPSAPVSTYATAPPAVPENIYVFDKDGKPLTGVYLYDENGRPLDSAWYDCFDRRVDNQYPRPRVEHDEGGCRVVPGVPFAAIIPNTPQGGPTPTTPGSATESATAESTTAVPTTTGSAPPAPQPTTPPPTTTGVVPTT